MPKRSGEKTGICSPACCANFDVAMGLVDRKPRTVSAAEDRPLDKPMRDVTALQVMVAINIAVNLASLLRLCGVL